MIDLFIKVVLKQIIYLYFKKNSSVTYEIGHCFKEFSWNFVMLFLFKEKICPIPY